MMDVQNEIISCYREIFVTLSAIAFMTILCAFLCYADYKEEKQRKENRKKRLEQRRKRREGTRWETRN